LLDNNDIQAYIAGGEDPVLFVKQNGINETIMKTFLDNYRQTEYSVQTIMEKNPDALNQGLIADVMKYDSYVNEKKDPNKPDALLIYFYALLAYTCIFAANRGLEEVINIQADQSKQGARVNVSPISKMKLFLCNLLASFTVHCGSLILLFVYMYYGIKVNFGDNIVFTFITCLVGSLTGLALGATVGVWVKKKAEVKEAILTMVVLGGGFLSGMMVADMKYLIQEKVPLLSYINPVNLVSDSLYSLYYYDTYDRFLLDMIILCVMTVLLGLLSYLGIRRKNYASI
jgi:ABC-2 type transport system permease protein